LRKNIRLLINTDTGSALQLNYSANELQLNAARAETVRYESNQITGLIYRFLSMPCSVLKTDMIIMHNTVEELILKKIRELLFRQLHFYPEFRSYRKERLQGGRFCFVIDNKPPEKSLMERPLYTVASMRAKGNVRFFHIRERDSLAFFNSFYDLFLNEI
jgi:hypothetical protein